MMTYFFEFAKIETTHGMFGHETEMSFINRHVFFFKFTKIDTSHTRFALNTKVSLKRTL